MRNNWQYVKEALASAKPKQSWEKDEGDRFGDGFALRGAMGTVLTRFGHAADPYRLNRAAQLLPSKKRARTVASQRRKVRDVNEIG
jgi:hypothetical protein